MLLTSIQKTNYRATKRFRQLREEKLKEVGYRCECCSVYKKKGLHIHHKNELAYKEENEKDFLIVLCPACHEYIEDRLRVINNKKNPETVGKKRLREFLYNFTEHIEEI